MKNWNSRFFVLERGAKCLQYYTDDTKKDKRGEIILDGKSIVAPEEDHKDRKFLINVTGLKHNRSVITYLSCASHNERQIWYDAITEVAFGLQVRIPEVFPDKFRSQTTLNIVYYDETMRSPDTNEKITPSKPKKRASMKEVELLIFLQTPRLLSSASSSVL